MEFRPHLHQKPDGPTPEGLRHPGVGERSIKDVPEPEPLVPAVQDVLHAGPVQYPVAHDEQVQAAVGAPGQESADLTNMVLQVRFGESLQDLDVPACGTVAKTYFLNFSIGKDHVILGKTKMELATRMKYKLNYCTQQLQQKLEKTTSYHGQLRRFESPIPSPVYVVQILVTSLSFPGLLSTSSSLHTTTRPPGPTG